jgi:hypothetical protein
LKRILIVLLVVTTLFSNSVFAQTGKTEVTGNIQPAIINVDIPSQASFIIDPNGPTFIAPELFICNNSTMPISVSMTSFDNKVDTPNQFEEVEKNEKDWWNLGTNGSKRFIYLGIGADDLYQEGYVEDKSWNEVISATQVQTETVECASIRPSHTVSLQMECNYGRAISGAFTTTYELVFIVSVMD